MLRRYAKYIFLFYLLLLTSLSFGQRADINARLADFKSKNDLTNWIYERLDYVNQAPEQRLPMLMRSQNERWRSTQNADEHFAWLNLLSTQGYYQLLDGDIIGSINSYESALAFFEKHNIVSYDIVEYTLKPLSNNYTRLGDYERALYIQQRCLDLQRQYNNDSDKMAAIYCNMAISYHSMGRVTDARQTINKGFALKPSAFTLVMLNNIYADVLFAEQKYQQALSIIEQNIEKQTTINAETAYWLMGSYTTAGDIYLALQRNEKAKNAYQKALNLVDTYFSNSRLREKGNLFTQLGKTALAQNKPKNAIAYFYQTLATLGISDDKHTIIEKNIYGDNKLMDVFLQLANANLLLAQPEEALNYIRLSLKAVDKIRNEFAADRTKERLQKDLKKIAEKGIAICYERYQHTKNRKYLHEILLLAEQSKARTLLDQIERNQKFISEGVKNDSLFVKKQMLERAIVYQERELLTNNGSKQAKTIASLKYQLATLNKSIAKKYKLLSTEKFSGGIQLNRLATHRFISYFFGEQHIYVIDIHKQQVKNVIRLNHAPTVKRTITNFVKTYFQEGPSAMNNRPKAFFYASNQVYQLILAPLKLNSGEKITIIPDGILGYLSFDGLITNNKYTENIGKWPFFIRAHATSYGFSIQTLLMDRKNIAQDGFAGLFITHAIGNKTALNAVATEAKLMKKHISGTFLFNEAVSTAAFEKLFEQNKVLHIGTHAYLTGKNREPTLDFGKEKVYLFELSAKNSAPALVVLSACRTADGLLANGEGIISLSRGFTAIGTSATIASLWNVNDDAAANITANFYRLLTDHTSASDALRQAKLNWLNSAKNSNALLLPYYWDSLVYIGQDQEISLPKPTNWRLYGLLLAAAALGFVLYRVLKQKFA